MAGTGTRSNGGAASGEPRRAQMPPGEGEAPDLDARLASVRLLVFDFDGVFTDNTVLVFTDGNEAVRCWRSDGLGLARLRELGLPVHIVSTEPDPVVAARARKLDLPVRHGVADKLAVVRELAAAAGCGLDAVAYVGNDVNDAACLSAVGLPIVVADGHPAVLGLARWRTAAPGGRGAVREVCDRIAAARHTKRPGQ